MPSGTEVQVQKPFLRWAGGKSWLIKHLDTVIGNYQYNGYHEPFLGGAAIFFTLAPQKRVFLSDLNQELIETYKEIQRAPLSIINYLKEYENTAEFYYSLRKKAPRNSSEAAARFIYLNQTSYNGLYRVNQQGMYNVPYGFRSKKFLEEGKLLQASQILQNASLFCGDFDAGRANIRDGDLVFLDPPYTVSHNNNGFIKYNQKLFSIEDQKRLSLFIDYIKGQGAFYILTNAAHKIIKDIFSKIGDRRLEFSRANLIGGENAERGQITEYVFTNIPEVR